MISVQKPPSKGVLKLPVAPCGAFGNYTHVCHFLIAKLMSGKQCQVRWMNRGAKVRTHRPLYGDMGMNLKS